MTLADDYKEVIAEIGEPATIIRSSGNIASQMIHAKVNAQVTKPFIREFFMEADLPSDSSIVAGDVFRLADNRVFLVMNKTPKVFEAEIYCYTTVLYKCNATGVLFRPMQRKIDHKAEIIWARIVDPCYALITESFYGHELEDKDPVGPVSKLAMDCYVSHSSGAQKGDRYFISATEYFQVESIMTRRYDSVDIALLGEDTRGSEMMVSG